MIGIHTQNEPHERKTLNTTLSKHRRHEAITGVESYFLEIEFALCHQTICAISQSV